MLADIVRDVYEALRFMTQLLTKDVSQGVTIASTISSGKIRGLLISEEKRTIESICSCQKAAPLIS